MLTPHPSPSIPSVPHNMLPSAFQPHKARKPPIHNPYDKFTQPEFDAWINDITGALRRALGREPVLSESPGADPKNDKYLDHPDHGEENVSVVGSEDSRGIEDSFVDVKARHSKGKARDPREGPGLGSQHQPIDLESESDGEEDPVSQGLPSDEVEHEEIEEWEEEEEGNAQSGEEGSPDYDAPSRMNGYDNGEDEVIELISDEEDRVAPDEGPDDEDADDSDEQRQEQETVFPPFVKDSFSPPPEIPDPWEGPRTYAEDYYSGGDLPESDLRFDRHQSHNLTPLRQEQVESHRTFLLDNELAHPPSRAAQAADITLPKTLYMDVEQSQLYDNDSGDVNQGNCAPSHGQDDDVASEIDVAKTDEQSPIVVDDVEEPIEIDAADIKDASINAADTFSVDEQESAQGNEPVYLDSEATGNVPLEPLSVELPGTPSLLDFGVLPDTSPDGESALMAGQLDMSEVLSFFSYDGDEGAPQKIDDLGDDDGNNPTEHNHTQPEAASNGADPLEEIIGPADKIIDGVNPPDEPSIGYAEGVAETLAKVVADSHLPAPHSTSSVLPLEFTSAIAGPTVTSLEDIASSPEPETSNDKAMTSNTPCTPDVSQPTNLLPMTSPSREIRDGIPMPVSADPNVPDPTMQTLLTSPVRTPMVLSLPGTPAILLSPVTTPGIPASVSVAVPTSVLRAMQIQQSLSTTSTSGLFTPANGSESAPGTPGVQRDDGEVPNSDDGVPTTTIAAEDAAPAHLTTRAEPIAEERAGTKSGIPVIEEVVIDGTQAVDEEPEDMDISDAVQVSDQREDAGDDEEQAVKPPSLTESNQTEGPLSIGLGIPGSPSTPIPASPPIIYRSEPQTPILHADPYPYSLSTPGTMLFDQDSQGDDVESPSEEENDFSHSSSSYTARNEMETHEDGTDQVMGTEGDESDFELLYPSEAAEEDNVFTAQIQEVADIDDENDTFVPDEPQEQVDTKMNLIVSPHIQSILPSDNSDMVTDPTAPEEVLEAESEEHVVKSSPVREVTPPGRSEEDSSDGVKVRTSKSKNVWEGDQASPRPFKRHRPSPSPPTPTSRPVPRESSGPAGKVSETTKKGKEKAAWADNERAADSESTSSGASTALRMLYPGSRTSSRASSVAYSDSSCSSKPTSTSASRPPGGEYDNLSHLFHAHGAARQHHQLQPLPSPAKQTDRTQQITPPRAKQPHTDVISRSEPGLSQRSALGSGSPITRSNCRFHRISLPLKEGGPRVYFLVPGCSLGDKKLMEAQDIRDHGYATAEDGRRVIRDLDSLDFNSYFIGVLRQLVGVDLLREQEIFYLPQPGENHSRRGQRRTAATRLSLRDPLVHATPSVSLPAKLKSKRSSSPPTRDTSSSKALTPTSTPRKVEAVPDSSSVASSSDGQHENGHVPSPSQRRVHANKDLMSSSVGELTPPSSTKSQAPPASGRRVKGKRNKRLDIGALAYKPSVDPEDTSGDEKVRDRRSKLKRTRTSETTTLREESDRKKKHKRLRLTSSAAAVPEQS